MANFEKKVKDVIVGLHNINALKFGSFKVKAGIESPVYFDLRTVVAYPELMVSYLFFFIKLFRLHSCVYRMVT